jgi:hypothetical protein
LLCTVFRNIGLSVLITVGASTFTSCELFRSGNVSGRDSHSVALQGNHSEDEDHAHEHPHDHSHGHDQDHRMFGGWDSTTFPTAMNLYRLMNGVAELPDTTDHGNPSLADMFVANFSAEYMRYVPDSAKIALLKPLVRNPPELYISGAAFDEATQLVLPRMARVLDMVRYDSSRVHYRSRSLNGQWLQAPQGRFWTADTLYPAAFLYGRSEGNAGSDALRRPEAWLLAELTRR